jgi:hypothetical protein
MPVAVFLLHSTAMRTLVLLHAFMEAGDSAAGVWAGILLGETGGGWKAGVFMFCFLMLLLE